jgi:hypothetical protein
MAGGKQSKFENTILKERSMFFPTRRTCIVLAILGLVAPGEAKAGPTVVTFDSIQDRLSSASQIIPDGYGGIIWGGKWATVPFDNHLGFFPFDSNGPGIAPTSGYPSSFQFVTPQVYDGAYFDQDTRSAPGNVVTVQLFDNSVLVATSSVTFGLVQPPTFIGSGYSGLVDTVVVTYTVQQGPFRALEMDLITYGPVPEPSSLVLTGIAAFSGLGYWGWRRRRANSA